LLAGNFCHSACCCLPCLCCSVLHASLLPDWKPALTWRPCSSTSARAAVCDYCPACCCCWRAVWLTAASIKLAALRLSGALHAAAAAAAV
jgi:hypothetical protein